MRTIHRVKPGAGCAARSRVPRLCRLCSPGNDTSLDYRERTISRTEVAILGNGLISAGAGHVGTAEQAGSRARTAYRKWSRLGVGQ
jgi:hypothetical protein